MSNIEISKAFDTCCNHCGEKGNEIFLEFEEEEVTEINLIHLSDFDVYLCDECLKGIYENLRKTIEENK